MTFESQPQTYAPFSQVEPNLTNYLALENPKRINKLFSNKTQGFIKQTYKSHEKTRKVMIARL